MEEAVSSITATLKPAIEGDHERTAADNVVCDTRRGQG